MNTSAPDFDALLSTASAATLLAAASDRLSQIARQHRLNNEQFAAMAAAAHAAEFLYDLAEGLARGETTAPGERTRDMEMAQRFVAAKLAELQWGHEVKVLPDAAQYQGFDWAAFLSGDESKAA